MSWDRDWRDPFLDALVASFDLASFREMLRTKLLKNLEDFPGRSEGKRTQFLEVILEAERAGWLEELVSRAHKGQPSNAKMMTFHKAYLAAGAPTEITAHGIELSGLARKPGVPYQSEPLPPHYVERPEEERRLQESLLCQDRGRGVEVIAVFGMGGSGKSILAAAVVQKQAVRDRFPDGILWATLGQEPEVQSLLTGWLRALGDYEFRGGDVLAVQERLRKLLQKSRMLLVIDDAWSSREVEKFQVGGPLCWMLITTRNTAIADDLNARLLPLAVMTPDQAMVLFTGRLQRALRQGEEGPARDLLNAVGCLPLAVELVAAQIADGILLAELLSDLRQEVARLESLNRPGADEAETEEYRKKRSLRASIQLSLGRLKPQRRKECFAWLGLTFEDTVLNPRMAAVLWQTDERKARVELLLLRDKALLMDAARVRVCGDELLAFRLHDVMHDSARELLTAPLQSGEQGGLAGLGLTLPNAHRLLLARYRDQTRNGQWHTLRADGYIHGRLGWHLEQARDIEGLHALLREETVERGNGWFEACDGLGQGTAFRADVARARCLLYKETVLPGEASIGVMCRYALMTASLNSLFSNVPPELCTAALEKGLWSQEQALAYARQVLEAGERAEALAMVAAKLPSGEKLEVLREGLGVIRTIYEGRRKHVLGQLAPLLPAELWPDALCVARDIRGEQDRAEALTALGAQLLEKFWSEVLAEVERFHDDGPRVLVLEKLASSVPHRRQEVVEVVRQTLQAARAVPDEHRRMDLLVKLFPILPPELLPDAFDAAREIDDEFSRSAVLESLIPLLPPELLPDALQAVREMDGDWLRLDILKGLAPRLTDELWLEALRLVREGSNTALDGDEALATLAPLLPEKLLPEAFQVAREISCSLLGGWKALAAVARRLPEDSLPDALQAILAIGDPDNLDISHAGDRAQALAAVAPRLPEVQRQSLIGQALSDVKAARDRKLRQYRVTPVQALAPLLTAIERHSVVCQALEDARSIADDKHRGESLAVLTSLLAVDRSQQAAEDARGTDAPIRSPAAGPAPAPAENSEEVVRQKLQQAQASPDDGSRSLRLVYIAKWLSGNLLAEALQTARGLRDGWHRAAALAALAAQLPETEQQQEVAREAVRAAGQQSRDGSDVSHPSGRLLNAMATLAGLLPDGEREEVARLALHGPAGSHDHGWWAAESLATLGLLLPEEERQEVAHRAIQEARRLGENDLANNIVPALAALLPLLPEGERAAVAALVLRNVTAMSDERTRDTAVANLAPSVPDELLPRAFEAIEAMTDVRNRARVLAAAADRLPAELLPRSLCVVLAVDDSHFAGGITALATHLSQASIRQTIRTPPNHLSRGNPGEWIAVLLSLVPEHERGSAVRHLLNATQAVSDQALRARWLVTLLRFLQEEEREEAIQQALQDAVKIHDGGDRRRVVATLAPALPPRMLPQAIEIMRGISDKAIIAEVITALARLLPVGKMEDVARKALSLAEDINDESGRGQALNAVAKHLPANLQGRVFKAVLDIRDESVRGHTLAGLTRELPEEWLPKALEAVQAIKNPLARVSALSGLIPRFSAEEVETIAQRALDESQSFGEVEARSRSLERLAPVLPVSLLPEALRAATKLNGNGRRAVDALISRLPKASPDQALQLTQLTEKITDEGQRGAALASLAPVLQGPPLRQALQVAQTTLTACSRMQALAKLADRLEPRERDAVARQAFDDVQAIRDDWTRGLALAWLVAVLPADLLSKALEVARKVGDPSGRLTALAWLAKVAPRQSSQQQEIAREALFVAQSIPDEYKQREELVWLASHLPEDQLPEVFLAVQKLPTPWQQVNAWKEMARPFPEQLFEQAIQAAASITEQAPRGRALAALVPHIPNKLLPWALQATKALRDESARMEVIAAFAQRAADLPTDDVRAELLRDALQVPETRTRLDLLKYLGQLVPLLELVGSKDALVEVYDAIDDVARWWR